MTIKGILIGVLAIVGLAVLGNSMMSGGSAGAHGGDDSLVHLCVSKVGTYRTAFVVSPKTNCPPVLFDQVHLEQAGAGATIPFPQTCAAGEFVSGIGADGSLVCAPVLTANSFYITQASYNGTGNSGETACDTGDVVMGGGGSAVDLSGSGPGSNNTLGNNLTGWVAGGDTFLAAFAVCLDLAPLRP